MPRFGVVTALVLVLNAGTMYIAVDILAWSYLWGMVGAALVIPPTYFLLNYYWAFK